MSDLALVLDGSAAEVGRAYGALVAPVLRDRVRRLRGIARQGAPGPSAIVERGLRLRASVARIAPEWVEEAEATAAESGIEPDDLFALNALPEGFWDSASGGCTSCVVVGGHSATGDTLAHKNRDVRNEIQDFHLRHTRAGVQLFASRDIGNLGFAHFHSDHALAGANNTGSRVLADERRDCGLSCCHLLRLVAERAASCDQAVAVLEDALSREVAGGSSPSRGMIFLFAEPDRGVVVEMTAKRLAVEEQRHGTLIRSNHFLINEMHPFESEPPSRNTLRRCERAHELLDPLAAKRPADLVRLSRDHTDGPDSICSDDAQHFWMTQSACVHVVRANSLDPDAHTLAAMGNPRNTFFVPVPRAISGLPAACVDGSVHNLSRMLYARQGVGLHLAERQEREERALQEDFAALKAALRGQPAARVRAALTRCVARWIDRVRDLLTDLIA